MQKYGAKVFAFDGGKMYINGELNEFGQNMHITGEWSSVSSMIAELEKDGMIVLNYWNE